MANRKAMAKTKRRIEITVERHRLVILRRRNQAATTWCQGCREQVLMVTADEAATIGNVSSRTIYRRVESGELHYAETAEGRLLVCSNSIAWREKSIPT
jgi:hypothetical protein